MSGLELPGLILGIVPLALQATVQAWKVLDDTVTFSKDTEDLSIRLETAKAHLGIWATQVGLTQGELANDLSPLSELIERTLRRICDLITEINQQGTKYGLGKQSVVEHLEPRPTAAIVQMRRSLHFMVTQRTDLATKLDEESTQRSSAGGQPVNVTRKILWAIHDKKKFENFLEVLEKHIEGLHKFALGYERKQMQQESTRLALNIVAALSESNALLPLYNVPTQKEGFSNVEISSLAQWKSITLVRPSSPTITTAETHDWSLFGSSREDRAKTRFLKIGNIEPDAAYLFEKKEYDPNISDHLKDSVRERISRLVALLSGSKAPRHLHTLKALGYLDDPEYHCWWIVFRFPLSPMDSITPETKEPLSLRVLLSSPIKPALEARYKLAKRLVDAFAQLYGSDWMHKGINSKNIIFARTRTAANVQGLRSIESALIQGFNYSRQLTQAQTIDQGKVLNDLESAIYRHPSYQGDAAIGYQIHYDIYSLGLVLFEIAVWGPLMDILAAKSRPGKTPPVALAPDMRYFHEAEAEELRRRVSMRVENELAYRVGTKYKELVRWCLHLTSPVTAVEFYNVVAVPLDELCG